MVLIMRTGFPSSMAIEHGLILPESMPTRSMYATSHQSHITGLTCMNMYDTYRAVSVLKEASTPRTDSFEVVDALSADVHT